jgi:uncharacterized membrane protein
MDPLTSLLLMFLVGGAVLIGFSLPLILGRVPPNPWYGFRVGRSIDDPKLWYPVNAYSGRWLLAVGVLQIVLALALYAGTELDVDRYALLVAGVAVGLLGIGFFQSYRYLRRLTRENDASWQ